MENNFEERLSALEDMTKSFFENKTKSIEKKMDTTGRIVIPKSVRILADCEDGGNFKIYVMGDKIILEKI